MAVERHMTPAGGGANDGTSKANAWTMAKAITDVQAGDIVHVYGDSGTYTNTTTSRNFNIAGTTIAPILWRGCNIAPGDLDNDFVTAKPAITFTTGVFTIGAAHQVFSNLNISGANTGIQLNVSSTNISLYRLRSENTNSASGARAISSGTGQLRATCCWFKTPSTAAYAANHAVESTWLGCTFTGGGCGLNVSAGTAVIAGCTFRENGSHGIELTVGTSRPFAVLGCTFRGTGGDGIRFTALPIFGLLANNLFASIGGYGVNNATGTNTNIITRIGNAFWSCTSGHEAGFGDSPSLAEIAESADPHTSATDLSLVIGALSRASGQPGKFENEPYTSHLDRGAVQHAEPTDAEVAAAVWAHLDRTLTA